MAVPKSIADADRPGGWVAARSVERTRRRITGGMVAELVGRYVLYAVLLVFFLLPFVWMFFGAVRRESEIIAMMFPLSIHTIWPVEWSFDSFLAIYGLNQEGRAGNYMFHRGLLNSGITAGAVVLLSLVFNTMAAYFFARLPFPGKRFLLAYVIATFMIPADITIVPLYIVANFLGLVNSLWALIVPFYASPFIVFLLMQFMYSLPKELDEAALVDGANYWQILWWIVFPNTLPALATASLIEFQFIWNNFFWPLVATGDLSLQVIQVMIATQFTDRMVYWGRIFAGMVSAVLPVLLLFLACQRFYFRGAVLSGMK
ncbi:MAG TPA: carbohydrate ABC transporter permease [Chloroflexota bacterium]|jgi:multiple sugar transport system permease protein|nr:carbohydrate ABC transporter permease [Chloroflexota bacterium]